MSGETCPRCRHRNGYPVPHTIPNANKMVFVCRDCGHRWQKRKISGIPTQWFVYGIGFLIGIIYGLYELYNRFLKDSFQGFIEKIKDFF
jgi:hypothetical protein